MRKFPRLGLSHICLALAGFGILVFLLALLPLIMSVSSDITARQNTAMLRDHGRIAGAQFSRIISSEWQKLERLQESVVQGESRDLLRLRFDMARAMNEDCAWVGFADTSGKVLVASGGILEGESVLERPWFRSGIDAPFAGDKHEAVLLSRYLVPKSAEPIRLIDLAMPVKDKSGKLVGVIAMHIDWHWVRTFIGTFGTSQGVDLLLISRAGDVVAGPPQMEGSKLSLMSTLAAGQGVGYFESETWPDGQRYMVSVEPIQGTATLPSFGWSLLVRQRADLALAPARAFVGRVLPFPLIASIVLLLGAFAMGRWLGKPLVRLSASATEMAEGRFGAPVPDERQYQEVATLSAALARLQSEAEEIGRAEAASAADRARGPTAA